MSTNRDRENKFSKSLKKKALMAKGSVCGICGCNLTMITADPHHIIPVSSGGLTVRENCLIVCRPCHIGLHS